MNYRTADKEALTNARCVTNRRPAKRHNGIGDENSVDLAASAQPLSEQAFNSTHELIVLIDACLRQ